MLENDTLWGGTYLYGCPGEGGGTYLYGGGGGGGLGLGLGLGTPI